MTIHRLAICLISVTLLIWGCGLLPERVSRDDDRLKPMWAAIALVDRESLGFTPIEADAEIRLEGKQFGGDDYDAMLHIEGSTSRTIAFRRDGATYLWIGEQEIYTGPNSYTSVDGTFQETIAITYKVDEINGVPSDTLIVSYFGDDPRLARRFALTMADVAPVIEEWRREP